jgi:hypothetical protein
MGLVQTKFEIKAKTQQDRGPKFDSMLNLKYIEILQRKFEAQEGFDDYFKTESSMNPTEQIHPSAQGVPESALGHQDQEQERLMSAPILGSQRSNEESSMQMMPEPSKSNVFDKSMNHQTNMTN